MRSYIFLRGCVCALVRRSVRPSNRPSVQPLVGSSSPFLLLPFCLSTSPISLPPSSSITSPTYHPPNCLLLCPTVSSVTYSPTFRASDRPRVSAPVSPSFQLSNRLNSQLSNPLTPAPLTARLSNHPTHYTSVHPSVRQFTFRFIPSTVEPRYSASQGTGQNYALY